MAAPAVLRTLEHAWSALEPLNLPMAVAGGLALSAWRYPRSTRDVDLVVQVEAPGIPGLIDVLIAAGFHPKRTPAALGTMKIVQLEFEPAGDFVTIPTDLLLVDSDYHRAALARRVAFRLPDIATELYVLSCEDLVLHKLLAGRIIDRSDAAALIRANRASLQIEYLQQWVRRLRLEREFREVWNEACPDEPPVG
ncbi:MAG: hypothetical protein ACT4QC_00440 [Planctomycetaceae bacterium]